MRIKNLPKDERPRERLLRYGSENLSNEDLLSIIFKTGTYNKSVKEISCNLLEQIGDIRNLKDVKINKLKTIEGIGDVKAIELMATIELGRRIYQDISEEELVNCSNSLNIIKYFNYIYKDRKQEEFYVLYLDKKYNLLEKKKLFIGTIDFSQVHPREIFKEAYLLSASYILCIHNHPSGDATPSKDDMEITKRIKRIGDIHAIPLLDHIIIGNNNYYSFYEDKNIIGVRLK